MRALLWRNGDIHEPMSSRHSCPAGISATTQPGWPKRSSVKSWQITTAPSDDNWQSNSISRAPMRRASTKASIVFSGA